MNSKDIVKALADQHTKDVFVSECKDGPSWTGSHARMDVWTMTRSWSKLCFTGYEIKVSRSDFLRDNKWHAYLPLCNQLYFVCPVSLIKKDEVPAEAGLKYVYNSGAVRVIKKASHRDVQPPMELFCYLLMARTEIVLASHFENHFNQSYEHRLETYKKMMEQKEKDRDLGGLIAWQVHKRMLDLKLENDSLKKNADFVNTAITALQKMGINNYWGNPNEDDITRKIAAFNACVPPSFKAEIKSMMMAADRILQTIESHEKKTQHLNTATTSGTS